MSFGLLRRAGMLVLLAATSLSAQFSQFATTDDGKQVYFISPLMLYSSTSTSAENRLYRIGPDGVTLAAERPPFDPSQFGGYSSGSGDGVSGPQVSGDGSLLGFTFQDLQTNCIPSMFCSPIPAEAELRGAKTQDLGPGTLQLSRNGRWALILQSQSIIPVGGQPGFTGTLIDLTTSQQTSVPVTSPFVSRAVASDGSVLIQSGIWKQGAITPLPAAAGASSTPLTISDDASTVVAEAFVSGQPGSLSLIAINLASGKITTLRPQTATQFALFMGLSNNGSKMLYRFPGLASADGPAFVADTSTGVITPIALPRGETVLDGTLSGDGTVAILATNLGRILRVTLAAGVIEPLIPPTPYFSNVSEFAIGSLTRLSTTYSADWTGALLLDGKPLPVLATKPGEVDVQIPWEQASGQFPLRINLQTGSPFEQVQSVFVSPIAPTFIMLPAGQTAIFPIEIIKGDWSGYQTAQPQPGDIVYLYMTGLGPVTGPVETGVPAPLTIIEPIQNPLTCTFTPETTPAQTLFAGLAPGLIGIYQVAFRMPADPNTKPLNGMQCTLGTSASFSFGIIGAFIGGQNQFTLRTADRGSALR